MPAPRQVRERSALGYRLALVGLPPAGSPNMSDDDIIPSAGGRVVDDQGP